MGNSSTWEEGGEEEAGGSWAEGHSEVVRLHLRKGGGTRTIVKWWVGKQGGIQCSTQRKALIIKRKAKRKDLECSYLGHMSYSVFCCCDWIPQIKSWSLFGFLLWKLGSSWWRSHIYWGPSCWCWLSSESQGHSGHHMARQSKFVYLDSLLFLFKVTFIYVCCEILF